MKILNNTPNIAQCNISNQNGKILRKFKIFSNDIYHLELLLSFNQFLDKQIYKLKCNKKFLEIELF